VSEIREEFNENLLDHNKVPIPSPQPGDMVFSHYTGSPGLVLENLKKNKSRFYGVNILNLLWVNLVTL
jgi:hypothetical protein